MKFFHRKNQDKPNEELTPTKPQTKKGIVRRVFPWVLMVISAAVLIYSLSNIAIYYLESYNTSNQNSDLKMIYQPWMPSDSASSASQETSSAPGLDTYGVDALKNMNPQTMGWISIPNTTISYPVMQGSDNNYYLKHDFYKKYSNHGSIYLDYRCDITSLIRNTVIYGHNMKDGQMFGSLLNYTDVNYYKKAPFIVLDNGKEKVTWVIFAMFYANSVEEQGPIFYYNKVEFAGGNDYQTFLKRLLVRSVINTGVDVNADDSILTLSTCAYNFTDARFAVIARKLRPSEQATITGNKIAKNPNALYPDIWYQINGGTKPDEQQLIDALG